MILRLECMEMQNGAGRNVDGGNRYKYSVSNIEQKMGAASCVEYGGFGAVITIFEVAINNLNYETKKLKKIEAMKEDTCQSQE